MVNKVGDLVNINIAGVVPYGLEKYLVIKDGDSLEVWERIEGNQYKLLTVSPELLDMTGCFVHKTDKL